MSRLGEEVSAVGGRVRGKEFRRVTAASTAGVKMNDRGVHQTLYGSSCYYVLAVYGFFFPFKRISAWARINGCADVGIRRGEGEEQ